MAEEYTHIYTGSQIDEAVGKALDITSTPENIDVAVAQELATADYVVEQGTSGIWTYRKWASGIAECWGVQTGLTANLTTQWESSGFYYNSGDGKAPNFPFAFAAKPAVTVSVENGSGVSLIVMTNGSGGSTTKAPTVQLCRAGSASSVAYTLHWHVVGRWTT